MMAGANSSSSPVRVDLAGGWTDVGPYPGDFGGEVVNFAINLRVFARTGPDSGDSETQFEFPVPRGSGLGTSSAMNVALSALSVCLYVSVSVMFWDMLKNMYLFGHVLELLGNY